MFLFINKDKINVHEGLLTCGLFDYRSSKQHATFSAVSIRRLEVFQPSSIVHQLQKHIKLLETVFQHTNVRVTLMRADSSMEETDTTRGDYPESVKYDNRSPRASSDVTSRRLYPTVYNNGVSQMSHPVPKAELKKKMEFSSLIYVVSSGDKSSQSVEVKPEDEHERGVWGLASALFDTISLPPNELEKAAITDAQLAAVQMGMRREAFSLWIQESVKHQTEQEATKTGISVAEHIRVLLSGRQVGKAVVAAIEGRYLRLATIIGQIGGPGSRCVLREGDGEGAVYRGNGAPGRGGTDESTLKALQTQLAVWLEMEQKGTYFSEECMSVWRLLSGNVDCWDEKVCPSNLDWKRALGLFYWYGEGGRWEIPKAVETYERYCEAFELPRPLPPYMRTTNATRESGLVYDVCFHLLKLVADSTHPLEEALHPKTYTSNDLDYRLSWVLGMVLSTVKRIRGFKTRQTEFVQDLSQSTVGTVREGVCVTSDMITMKFIDQLVSLGAWTWAVYCAMFLSTHYGREHVIRNLLAVWYPVEDTSGSICSATFKASKRGSLSTLGFINAQSQSTGSETHFDFLTQSLQVPVQWIHDARALRARYEGNIVQELISMIDAGKHSSAHRILLAKVAPRRLIQTDFKLIKFVIDNLSEECVEGFNVGAGFLKQYIEIVEMSPTEMQNAREEQNGDQLDATRAELLVNRRSNIKTSLDILGNRFEARWHELLQPYDLHVSPSDKKMIQIAISEMAATLMRISVEIGYLLNDTVESGDLRLMGQMPLASNQRIGQLRQVASEWIDDFIE